MDPRSDGGMPWTEPPMSVEVPFTYASSLPRSR
jgi:hypothetical protein